MKPANECLAFGARRARFVRDRLASKLDKRTSLRRHIDRRCGSGGAAVATRATARATNHATARAALSATAFEIVPCPAAVRVGRSAAALLGGRDRCSAAQRTAVARHVPAWVEVR